MSARKNPSRVAAGLKAAVHNPRVSEEAKESAAERLQHMGAEVETAQEIAPQTGRTASASKSPPITSQRRHSMGSENASGSQMTVEGKSESRVMGGYKAALKNPRVSEEAKEHAEEMLEQHHVSH